MYYLNSINWKKTLLPYKQAVDELCLKFKSLTNEFLEIGLNSPIESVEGRVKSINSILEKASRKNIYFDHIEEKIEDIAGIRIICRFVEDIDKIIGIVRERNGKDLFVLKENDYIKNTKESGYRSYHIIIKYPLITMEGMREVNCEIQIRTLAMNLWATIEHTLKYKYNGNIPDELKERLKASSEAAYNLDKELGLIRAEILDAQITTKLKNDLVDEIFNTMKKLHYLIKKADMDALNKQFYEIYLEGDIGKLRCFNEKLNIMTQLHKVHDIIV